jgi:diguanylate cyclase (GGDEF)-like protein
VLQVPIKDDAGAVQSLVTNAVRLDALAEMAQHVRLGETSSVMWFDNTGVPIVYPDPERIAALQPLTDFPLVASAIAGQPGSNTYHNPVTQRDEIGVIVPIENGSFYVAVTQSQAEAFGAIHRLMTTLVLVLGTVVTLLLTAGLLFARSLARGMGIVERAAIGLAAGDVDQEVAILSDDELGRMAAAFRGMMAYQSRMVEVADAVAGGDLTQDVHPQSSRGRLGFALECMVTNLRKLVARLEKLAFSDALTGLPNRAVFLDHLQNALTRSRSEGTLVAVLFLDLDDFKPVNDTFGHEVGDRVHMTVADRLQGCVRPTGRVCRLGGDEFTILMEGVVDAEVAGHVARQVIDTLARPMHLAEQTLLVSSSVGIALGPGGYETPADLLRAADTALYTAKQGGKAQVALLESCRDQTGPALLDESGPRAA